jgi:hypothetical protein
VFRAGRDDPSICGGEFHHHLSRVLRRLFPDSKPAIHCPAVRQSNGDRENLIGFSQCGCTFGFEMNVGSILPLVDLERAQNVLRRHAVGESDLLLFGVTICVAVELECVQRSRTIANDIDVPPLRRVVLADMMATPP